MCHRSWQFGVGSINEATLRRARLVLTGVGDRLLAGSPPWCLTNLARSTQPCISLGSLNRVPALVGWSKGGNFTSARWQVTLRDPK